MKKIILLVAIIISFNTAVNAKDDTRAFIDELIISMDGVVELDYNGSIAVKLPSYYSLEMVVRNIRRKVNNDENVSFEETWQRREEESDYICFLRIYGEFAAVVFDTKDNSLIFAYNSQ